MRVSPKNLIKHRLTLAGEVVQRDLLDVARLLVGRGSTGAALCQELAVLGIYSVAMEPLNLEKIHAASVWGASAEEVSEEDSPVDILALGEAVLVAIDAKSGSSWYLQRRRRDKRFIGDPVGSGSTAESGEDHSCRERAGRTPNRRTPLPHG